MKFTQFWVSDSEVTTVNHRHCGELSHVLLRVWCFRFLLVRLLYVDLGHFPHQLFPSLFNLTLLKTDFKSKVLGSTDKAGKDGKEVDF